MKQISAQLRKANAFMYLISGEKHSPLSSRVQVVLRTRIPDFSKIRSLAISNVSRKIFECRSQDKFLNHFREVLGVLEYRVEFTYCK